MTKCKRCISAVLLGAMLLICVAVLVFAQDASTEGAEAMSTSEITDATFSSVIMNIGADETKRNVTWYSNYKTEGEIRWARASDATDGVFPAVYNSASATVNDTTKAGYYSYKATVSGLEADTDYVYCLVTGATVSEPYTFEVKDFGDEYTFVLAGDPQVGTSGGPSWSDTLAKIDKHFPETSFIVSAGDQTSTPTDETNYDNFTVDGVTDMAVAITLGTTHDNAAPYTTHYNLPNLSSTYGVSATTSDYFYKYNGTLFIHLNVESSDYESHAAFIKRTVANNPDCIWQVVVIHYPPYSGGNYGSNAAFREKLSSVYTECGIDAVLSGHDHMYARSELMVDNFVVSSDTVTDDTVTDPEGVLYICAAPSTTSAGFNDGPNSTDYTVKQDWTNRKSIIVFNMTETSMSMTAYYVDGDEPEAFDAFTIYHTPETVRLNGDTDMIEISTDGGATRIPLVNAYAYGSATVRVQDGIWAISEDGGATYTSLGISADEGAEDTVLDLNTETGYWELSADGGASFTQLPINVNKYRVTYVTDPSVTSGAALSAYPTHNVAAGELPDAVALTLPQGSLDEGVIYEWSWKYYSVPSGVEVGEFAAGEDYVAYLGHEVFSVSSILRLAKESDTENGIYSWVDAWEIVKKFPGTEFTLLVTEDLTLSSDDAVKLAVPVNTVIDLAGHTVDSTEVSNLITLNTGTDKSNIRIITSEKNGTFNAKSVFYLYSSARTTINLSVGGEESESVTLTGTYLVNAGNNFKNSSHLYLDIGEGDYKFSSAILYVFNLGENYNYYYVTATDADISTGLSPVNFKSGFCARSASTFNAEGSSFTYTGTQDSAPFFSYDQWYGTAEFTSCRFDGVTFDPDYVASTAGITLGEGCILENSDATFNSGRTAPASEKVSLGEGCLLLPIDGSGSVMVATPDHDALAGLLGSNSGSIYGGISVPNGAVGVYENTSADSVDAEKGSYVDSGRGDGSKVLVDTTDYIADTEEEARNNISGGNNNGAFTNITLDYVPKTKFLQDGIHMRYAVASFNIAIGEAATDKSTVARIRIYKSVTATTYNSETGEAVGTPKVTYYTSGSDNYSNITVLSYDAATGCVYIPAGMYDAEDNSSPLVLGSLGTELFTSFEFVIDSEENVLYYYVNGVRVAKKTAFYSTAETEPVSADNGDGTYTVTELGYGAFEISTWLGNASTFAGRWGTYGKTVRYFTNDESLVFDSEGEFVYGNSTPANGVFLIDGNYYFFENGMVAAGRTVEYNGYILELAEGTGRIVNCCIKLMDEFESMTDEEIKAASSDGTLTVGALTSGNLSAAAGKAQYTVPVYGTDENGNRVITGTTTTTLIKYTVSSGEYFRMESMSLGSELEYYASEEDIAAGKISTGVDNASITYNPGSGNLGYDCTVNFKVRLGDGVYTMKDKSGNALTSFNFFRFRMYNTSGKEADREAGVCKIVDGKPHIFFDGVDCGYFSTEEATDFTFVLSWLKNSSDKDVCSVKIYINGEYKYTWNYTYTGTKSYWRLSQYIGTGTTFTDTLYTYYPVRVYKTADGSNPEAITDGYTGYSDNGDGLIYYRNGDILYRGTVSEVEEAVGGRYAGLEGYSAALAEGSVHLNYFMNLGSLASEEGAYALITVDDRTEKIELADLVAEEDGLYRITARLTSIEMGEDVRLEIIDSDGNNVTVHKGTSSSASYTYSVKRYAEYIIGNADKYGEAATDAVKAMILYGAMAERNFKGEKGLATASALTNLERRALTFGTVGKIYEDLAVKSFKYNNGTDDVNGYYYTSVIRDNTADVDLTGNASDASKLGGVYLVLDSTIKIRIELTAESAPESVTGGNLYKSGSKYCIDIEDISVSDLNTVRTVTVDGTTVNITALAIANTVVKDTNGTYTAELADLMKAMYGYYYYIDLYIGSLGE